MRRQLYFLITLLCALTPPCINAKTLYLGGPYGFAPYSDSNTLTIKPAEPLMWPVEPGADIRLSLLTEFPNQTTGVHALSFEIACSSVQGPDTLVITLSTPLCADALYTPEPPTLLAPRITGHSNPILLSNAPKGFMHSKQETITLKCTGPSANQPIAIALSCGQTSEQMIWSATLPAEITNISAVGISTPYYAPPCMLQRLMLCTHASATPDTLYYDNSNTTSTATQPYVGYWSLLDYEMNDDMLRPGGDYTLAIVPKSESDNGYYICYHSGARINAAYWNQGMIKGELTPTPEAGVYRATWIDAEGERISAPATMQFLYSGTARLTFPTLGSTIRLIRIINP